MPVSKKPRTNTSKKSKRVATRRTQGWALLRDAHRTISVIMGAVTATARIAKDEPLIGMKDADKPVAKEALLSLKTALVVDQATQETVMAKAERLYSHVLSLINGQPYVKEAQIAPFVNQMTELLNHTIQTVLAPLGNLFDVYSAADNLSDHHVALLNAVDAHMKSINPQ